MLLVVDVEINFILNLVNNMSDTINPTLPVEENFDKNKLPTKKCPCCGRILFIDSFRKYAGGYRKICLECERKKSGKSDKFKDFSDKELYAELIARGWKGELKKVVEQKLKL